MTDVRSKSMATPVGDGDGDNAGDRISSLNDDLLVRILDLLPDTRDAVRTHALSRRWRGLWTGVTALRFDSDYNASSEVCREAGAAEGYLAFVNDTLALRAKATTGRRYAIKDLSICFDISRQQRQAEPRVLPLFKAAQGWIRYVVQNVVKSLILELDLPYWRYTEHPVMAIDDLASSAKLETLGLRLGYAQLGLSFSSTVVFASLTDLSIGDIMVTAGLLSRLVSSSCCPCLRKLHLSDLHFSTMEELLLEADALLELSMEMMYEVQSLELRTPSLQILRVDDDVDLERFKVVAAPRLEDLMFCVQRHMHIDDVHGHLSSVATLKIQLSSHGDFYSDDDVNDGSFDILKCCTLTRSLEVSLNVVETKNRRGDMIKGRFPPLPHVTSLTLHVTLREPHFFGSGIASFLAQCSSIRYLRLQLCYDITKKDLLEQDLLSENSCQWKSHEFFLAHLQEVEFEKLIGTDCELQFIRSILTRETRVQKVAVSFDPYYWIKDNKDALKLLPPLDGGSWTTCNNADLWYKWRRHRV